MEKISLEIQRHSAAHILAAAVTELYPSVSLGIGPAIEDGFYYDFDLDYKFTPEDLPKIEAKMRQIINKGICFQKSSAPISEAKKKLKDQKYKLELLQDLDKEGEKEISFYESGSFIDMCRGPHVENSKQIGAFKLTRVAGAYWKGDEKRPMMQRIYGLLFETQKELDDYLAMQEEAKKRDHRKLGRELNLFVFSDLVGPGLPLYTPKGTRLRKKIQDLTKELRTQMGYKEVWTQQINKAELFKISGHYDKYKDDMFQVTSHYTKEEYFLKPMNCPQHAQIYAALPRSYKDLPVRIADYANLYRDEKLGEVSGLSRLRGFSQDDSHCFCRPDQIKHEFSMLLEAVKKTMSIYGMQYWIRLSLRNPKAKEGYIGDGAAWKKSEQTMKELLKELEVEYKPAEDEAAFYGPKMDLMAQDSIGRQWQLSTIQLDFNMAGRFSLEYTDEKGKPQIPVMIHSAIVGSPERFMGVIIEHYVGAFPFWLAPLQVVVLPVSEKFTDYAREVFREISTAGIDAEIWAEDSLGKRIRSAEMQKVPITLIVGEKEVAKKLVSVRSLKQKDMGPQKLSNFIETAKEWAKERSKDV